MADIVAACSDTFEAPKPPWRARKERYLAELSGAPASVLLVSCADKLHNARCLLADLRSHGDRLWQRFNAGRDEVLWYYRALVDSYKAASPPPPLLEELERVVTALEEQARVGA